jgi:hypothetical protein
MRKFKKKCTFLIHKWKNQPQKEFHIFILYRGKMKKESTYIILQNTQFKNQDLPILFLSKLL